MKKIPIKEIYLLTLTFVICTIFIFPINHLQAITEVKKCPKGSSFNTADKKCKCNYGKIKKKRKCVDLPICKPGQKISPKRCKCAEGQFKDAETGTCIKEVLIVDNTYTNLGCNGPRIEDNFSEVYCTCHKGIGLQEFAMAGGLAPVYVYCKCKEPAVVFNGGCKCPEGKIYDGRNSCVDLASVEIPICEYYQSPKGVLNLCRCAQGAKEGSSGLCECLNGQTYVGKEGCKNICKEGTGTTENNPCACFSGVKVNLDGKCTCEKFKITGEMCSIDDTSIECIPCLYTPLGCDCSCVFPPA